MWNTELLEVFRRVFESFPSGGRSHDDSDQRGFSSQSRSFHHSRLRRREADILRCFSARRDLCPLFPIVAELPDQIERPSDENGVLGGCFRQEIVERLLRIGNDGAASRMMRRDFTELRSRDGTRGARFGENNFGRMWKEHSGDLVNRFIAKRSVKE